MALLSVILLSLILILLFSSRVIFLTRTVKCTLLTNHQFFLSKLVLVHLSNLIMSYLYIKVDFGNEGIWKREHLSMKI